jgi:hypothetical protein
MFLLIIYLLFFLLIYGLAFSFIYEGVIRAAKTVFQCETVP